MVKKVYLLRYEKEARKELKEYFKKKNYKELLRSTLTVKFNNITHECVIKDIKLRIFDKYGTSLNEAKILFKGTEGPKFLLYKLFHPGFPTPEPPMVVSLREGFFAASIE